MGNMGGNFANSSLREDKMRASLQKGERGGKEKVRKNGINRFFY